MTTETVSRNRHEAVVIEEGFFYNINKLGDVVRFKPGRKKKEAQNQNASPEVQVGGVPV